MSKVSISRCKSKLYKRDLYTTDAYDYLISKQITEYDIRDAGWNLIKYYNLLDSDKHEYLKTLPKDRRKKQIGIYMRDDKKFNKQMTESFKWIRREFFIANNISDEDVLSIKKDAIFIVGKKCKFTKFENVEFVDKHKYTSYHRFNNIEMYYTCSSDKLDVKGIDDKSLYLHEYFLNSLKFIFKLLESNDHDAFIRYMKKFVTYYKNKNLSIEYYRELNSASTYTLDRCTNPSNYFILGLIELPDDIKSNVNITYNYTNYILPILQRHLY